MTEKTEMVITEKLKGMLSVERINNHDSIKFTF